MRNFKYTIRFIDAKDMSLIEEAYFKTLEECKKWAHHEYNGEDMYFEIHYTDGARTYLRGEPEHYSRHGFSQLATEKSLHWIEKEYPTFDMPCVEPWWSVNNIPAGMKEDFQRSIK